MKKFSGKKIYSGVAIGKILYYAKAQSQVTRKRIDDLENEIIRYATAKDKAVEELNQLYEKAVGDVGKVNAQIFEMHAMMLDDEDYNDSVYNLIRTQSVNAEYAVAITGDYFSKMFENMEDEYFQSRAIDIKDISERVISILSGVATNIKISDEPVIIVALNLTPSETVQMDKNKLLSFVTGLGSTNSHTAILARMMSIPALIDVDVKEEWNGQMAIVDGYSGELIIAPDEETMKKYKAIQEKDKEKRILLETLQGKDDVTKSGKKIKLYANIVNTTDLAMVLQNDAAGIGLFRSEFLFLEKNDFPTEEEQFEIYKQVAQTMAGKKVIIRTLDIGADKQVDYFELEKEENPAMGYRAIRICLTRPEIFKTQLRAILRASAYGTIAIMYPMIISVNEVLRIKEIMKQVKDNLDNDGISYGYVEQGVMIETPAAAIISDLIAKEVDFFSIGTNDLTQYTLAIDRQNAKLDEFYDAHHVAVMRLIQLVVDNAHKAGIWAGICGELGWDLTLTQRFVEMGLDELSVSPGYILPIRKIIREMK